MEEEEDGEDEEGEDEEEEDEEDEEDKEEEEEEHCALGKGRFRIFFFSFFLLFLHLDDHMG